MQHRINWSLGKKNNFINFKWKYATKTSDYGNLTSNNNTEKITTLNLLEFHKELTDKRRFFLNLIKFCGVLLNFFIYRKTD